MNVSQRLDVISSHFFFLNCYEQERVFPKPLYTEEDNDLVTISSNLVGLLNWNCVDEIGQISEAECLPAYDSNIIKTGKGE